MTKTKLLDIIKENCNYNDNVYKIALPELLNIVAIDLFIDFDISSELAIEIRKQLLSLKNMGILNLEPEGEKDEKN